MQINGGGGVSTTHQGAQDIYFDLKIGKDFAGGGKKYVKNIFPKKASRLQYQKLC